MSLAEVHNSYIPKTIDTRPDLILVPELGNENPGQMGSLLFSRVFDLHHLSPTIMAADIAKLATVRSKNPDLAENMEPNFHPAELGAAYLANPALVLETVSRYAGQNSKAPRASEADIREKANIVFSLAERMLDVPADILDLIIKEYSHESDGYGIMARETEVKRLALLAVHDRVEKPQQPRALVPPRGSLGPQDDVSRDLCTLFPELNEVPELPVSGWVFKPERKLVLV